MEIQKDWDKTNLKKYLLYETWEPYKAIYILAGYTHLDSDSVDDFEDGTRKMMSDLYRLQDYWGARPVTLKSLSNDPYPPAHYIDWALSKRFRPDWMDWAIEQGLYTPKQEDDNLIPSKMPKEEVETAQVTTLDSDTPDEILAALFDPVTVTALAKMFPTDKDNHTASNDQWKRWAERASSNYLGKSRQARALFNPYKAAIWFLSKKIKGWDLARCHRVLANNLPARSIDQKHLLVGDQDLD